MGAEARVKSVLGRSFIAVRDLLARLSPARIGC
jgi:hypothetical protein